MALENAIMSSDSVLAVNPELKGKSSLEILDAVVMACANNGLLIALENQEWQKSDPVQFKRGFLTEAFLLAKKGILQATFPLWGIGLSRDKCASKGHFWLINVPFRNPI